MDELKNNLGIICLQVAQCYTFKKRKTTTYLKCKVSNDCFFLHEV